MTLVIALKWLTAEGESVVIGSDFRVTYWAYSLRSKENLSDLP